MNSKELILNILKPVNYPITKHFLSKYYQADNASAGTRNAKKVLVLAPHMDDETIGLGGTIKKHADEGADVYVTLITDGSNSVSSLSKEALTKKRLEEMEKVKSLLGIKDILYMGIPDGNVKSIEESQQKLQNIIEQTQPDIIYSTLFVDAHTDHTETAILLTDVIKRLSEPAFVVRLYEINCAIPPKYINCVVDISDTFDVKKHAIDTFQSQAIAFDGFIALNKWKSNLVKEKVEAAEVFLECQPQELEKQRQVTEQYKNQYPKIFKQINRTDTLLWAIFQSEKKKTQLYDQSIGTS
ncbi:PIG-L family deacetylase [Gracilibacillus sp. YIM 98692]|uniref:PIG-L deacetylase family protein n=1 Tax=Gracilibacillus sp. YIM 98692 TaxID=2663532 RepID=UPI0013D54223|nr:PIG-L family deacetylase [Gracilibacillus sp. YIM 98692]